MNLPSQTVRLNRFLIKNLSEAERRVYRYTCQWTEHPDIGEEAQALNRICYRLEAVASRWQTYILIEESAARTPPLHFEGETWRLVNPEQIILDCRDPNQRQALESLQRSRLRRTLERSARQSQAHVVEKGSDNSILFWKKSDPEEVEHAGWQVIRGYCFDLIVDTAANLYIEVDYHYHFHSPWTLQQWLDRYPELSFSWVRNTYRKNNQFYRWQFVGLGSGERPETVWLEGLNKTLAEYHRAEGATEAEIQNSQVVYVRNSRSGKPIPHLSCRLTPSLTLEMLSELQASGDRQLKQAVEAVFQKIRLPVQTRLQGVQPFVEWLCRSYYQVAPPQGPVQKTAYLLPRAVLLGKDGQEVEKVADVLHKGCARCGEEKFGLLNLCTEAPTCPPAITTPLRALSRIHGKSLEIQSFRTRSQMGESALARHQFWRAWADEGIQTILVMMPRSLEKQRIRNEALRVGIATQFFTPENLNPYKALNIVLGLLCKAKWQPIHLQPPSKPGHAELIIGFDTGTNRSLYFGTPAFAVFANGQSLGWELPTAQRGEKISGEAIWQTVLKLIDKFFRYENRYPTKVLLLRDGLAREDEFQPTIQELTKEGIAVDILSVRKSGAGRLAQKENHEYVSAPKGTVVFEDQERSFILISSQPIKSRGQELGSARPLRVVHEYGDTSLDLLAIQTYHLTQLHPGSAFSHARLPWVLHLAHRHSQEFARIEPLSLLQDFDRNKLIGV
ncbi:MAG: argonaute PAZ domain-containing protein [Thermosynechococcus sp.]|uniref:argonaute PAZ domain-containing protein n=1 Tax=Thermosynechococcus sp. TaxID=2814275 RepID=UPI00391B7E97